MTVNPTGNSPLLGRCGTGRLRFGSLCKKGSPVKVFLGKCNFLFMGGILLLRNAVCVSQVWHRILGRMAVAVSHSSVKLAACIRVGTVDLKGKGLRIDCTPEQSPEFYQKHSRLRRR